MSRNILVLLLSFFVCFPAYAHGGHGSGHSSHSSKASKSSKSDKPKTEHVRGYTKKDGTYVAPYNRSEPGTRNSGPSTRTTSERTSTFEASTYRKGHVAEGFYPDSSVRVNSHGKIKRSGAAKDAFKREHPCPANGNTSGSCKGYVIDHVTPLECGGADSPSNMQWQTVADGKAKDRTERLCRVH